MSKDRDEFVAILAREFPDRSSAEVIGLAGELMRLGRQYGRLQEAACNGELTADQLKREARVEQYIRGICREWKMGCILSGDPRGATVKLKLPSGKSNSWGGEGWCVPNS
jgi:hypothetical protein